MLSFLAGDRLRDLYGVKKTYQIGLWWSIPCILFLESGSLKEVASAHICLSLASIGGTIAISNGLSLLDVYLPSAASALLAGGTSILGARSGGIFAFRISQFGTGGLFWRYIQLPSMKKKVAF
jgi:hypothetical protein